MPSLPEMSSPGMFLEFASSYEGEDCLEWPFSKSGGGYGKIGRGGKTLDVHRLVCRSAHGEPPGPKYEAAHACGNRACCNPAHLRWDTRKGNHADKARHGTLLCGETHPNSTLSASLVKNIRSLRGTMLHREIADRLGVKPMNVGKILRGERWSNV